MTEFARIVEAYKAMADEARYRPAAPATDAGAYLSAKNNAGTKSFFMRKPGGTPSDSSRPRTMAGSSASACPTTTPIEPSST
jgi:hypothetical protein